MEVQLYVAWKKKEKEKELRISLNRNRTFEDNVKM